MKIKSLLIGMLACTALVGCTNNDDVVSNKIDNGGKNTSYVGVKLIMNENGGSRAATDGGYDTGDDAEQIINIDKSIFLFYDRVGNYVTFGTLVGQVDKNNQTEGDHGHTTDNVNINSIYGEKFIALSASEEAVKNIGQVLTVVNYHNIDLLKNKPLHEVLDVISYDTENKADARDTKNFLMTTSVYLNSDVVNTTTIGTDNICETQSEAYEKAIAIYIERAAAKMEVTSGNEDGSWLFRVEPTSEDEENDKNKEADEEGNILIQYNNLITELEIKANYTNLNIFGGKSYEYCSIFSNG